MGPLPRRVLTISGGALTGAEVTVDMTRLRTDVEPRDERMRDDGRLLFTAITDRDEEHLFTIGADGRGLRRATRTSP